MCRGIEWLKITSDVRDSGLYTCWSQCLYFARPKTQVFENYTVIYQVKVYGYCSAFG